VCTDIYDSIINVSHLLNINQLNGHQYLLDLPEQHRTMAQLKPFRPNTGGGGGGGG
jgi:hypothetical protein